MKTIPLGTSGKVAIVDDEDYPWLAEYKWRTDWNGYPMRCERIKKWRPVVFMHRVIMNAPKGMDVDYINHNKLDNRKENLRLCSHGDNVRHQRIRTYPGKTSRFKGVTWSKRFNRCRAQISINNKTTYLASCTSEIEAAKAYNAAHARIAGKFAILNPV